MHRSQLAFELNGIMVATDTNFVLPSGSTPTVLDLARHLSAVAWTGRTGTGSPVALS